MFLTKNFNLSTDTIEGYENLRGKIKIYAKFNCNLNDENYVI